MTMCSSSPKTIEVVSYDPNWPYEFQKEAEKIKKALDKNCIDIHHIGSTSIPGLNAKPIIDIIIVADNTLKAKTSLENIGFLYKGEYNIPFRLFLSKKEAIQFHIHLLPKDHPEIELNLLFKEYLCKNSDEKEKYALLKEELLNDKNAFEKKNSLFTGYNLGKDAFIREILLKTGFKKVRYLRCTHYKEWEKSKLLRDQWLSKNHLNHEISEWPIQDSKHIHLIQCKGTEVIGYAHLEHITDHKAVLHLMSIDCDMPTHFEQDFLLFCKNWLKFQNIQI